MEACVAVSGLAVMDAMVEAEAINWHGNIEEGCAPPLATRRTVTDELSFDLLDAEMRRTPNDAPTWEDDARGSVQRRKQGRNR